LPIPGNDDGIRSIEIIIRQIADSIAQAKPTTDAEMKAEKKPDVASEEKPPETVAAASGEGAGEAS
jgi:small subunit ribosomal protein S2